eukprot:5334436-Pleurochrysis_carterae.AAC.2
MTPWKASGPSGSAPSRACSSSSTAAAHGALDDLLEVVLRLRVVQHVEQREQQRRLARARRALHQHEALVPLMHLLR